MKPWKDIEKALNEELPPEVIQQPSKKLGIYGHWVKGHTIMELANAVFGPEGWSTNIVSPPKVEERVVGLDNTGDKKRMGLAVTVIVQVTGHGLDENGNVVSVTKTDMGWGTAAQSYNRQAERYDPLKPQNIRPAVLGAITIGFKRCLSQFGRKLGMQLYIPDENHMAMGWVEGAAPENPQQQRATEQPAPRQQQDPPPPESRPGPQTTRVPYTPPGQPMVSTTVSKLAKELGIEVTEANQRFLADLGVKEIKLRQVGKTIIRTKKVKEQIGNDKGSSVSVVYAMMPSYAIWIASEAATAERVSKPFQDMGIYDLFLRQTSDLRYVLQGGDYEPWPGCDIHDPTVMVGYSIEAAAIKSMKQGLIERFPSDDEQDCNPFALQNHLDKHFQVKRIGLLTWEQLAAVRLHVLEETRYPPRWQEKEPSPRADGGVPYQGMDMEPGSADEATKAAGMEPETAAETAEAAIGPTDPGPEPPETDYSGKCADLLMGIQKRWAEHDPPEEYDGNLVVFCNKKKLDLSSKRAFDVVEAAHLGIETGNLWQPKVVEMLLETALKGLAP